MGTGLFSLRACPNPTGVPPTRAAGQSAVWAGEGTPLKDPCWEGRDRPVGHQDGLPLPVSWAAQSREQGLRLGEAGVGCRGPGPHPTWPRVSLAPPGGNGRLPVPVPAGRKRKGPPVLPARVTVHPTRTGPLPPCGLQDRRGRAGFGEGGAGMNPSHHLDPISSLDLPRALWSSAGCVPRAGGSEGGFSTVPLSLVPATPRL